MPEAAARVHQAQRSARHDGHPPADLHELRHVARELVGVAQVGSAEGVHAQQFHVCRTGSRPGSLEERLERHAELALDAADESDRLQPRVVGNGQAQEDRLAPARRGGDGLEAAQLTRRLHGDDADAGGDRRGQFLVPFARSGHRDGRRVEAGPQDRLQLSARGHVGANSAAPDVGHDRQRRDSP